MKTYNVISVGGNCVLLTITVFVKKGSYEHLQINARSC